MSPLRTEDLVCLLDLMRSMQRSIAATNWKELELLDKKRRKLLQYESSSEAKGQSDLSENTNATEPTELPDTDNLTDDKNRDALINEIRHLDSQILEAVQASRQRLLDENRGLSDQKKAKFLYAKTSSMT